MLILCISQELPFFGSDCMYQLSHATLIFSARSVILKTEPEIEGFGYKSNTQRYFRVMYPFPQPCRSSEVASEPQPEVLALWQECISRIEQVLGGELGVERRVHTLAGALRHISFLGSLVTLQCILDGPPDREEKSHSGHYPGQAISWRWSRITPFIFLRFFSHFFDQPR